MKKKPEGTQEKSGKPRVSLPRDALKRISLGVSFAEHDEILKDSYVFVDTPATLAAADWNRQMYFFVGRRGTGKTATTLHLQRTDHHTSQVHPGIFTPTSQFFPPEAFLDHNQKPFKSLVAAFRLALQWELILTREACCGVSRDQLPPSLRRDLDRADVGEDFDARLIRNLDHLLEPLAAGNDRAWISRIGQPKAVSKEITTLWRSTGKKHTLALDRLDELWDGSDIAVAYLCALMHAILQFNTQDFPDSRALVFVRENVFERVRAIDPEFARIETSVVGMDWTSAQLIELVERRFNKPFSTRLPLKGPTWDYFYESGAEAIGEVFDICQARPRDIITYVGFAIEEAISQQHEKIMTTDLKAARRRFSDSRLKDVGDEYSENYPQIAIVLARFYGLGGRFTLAGIDYLLTSILEDQEVLTHCARWIHTHRTPEQFVRLLYNIGFLGLGARDGIHYRSSGPRDTTPPAISDSTYIVVHPSYWDALDLQDKVVTQLDGVQPHERVGLVSELPGAMTFTEYQDALLELQERMDLVPSGKEGAAQFEELVGDTLKLCFNRSLTNVEARQRTVDGKVIRDWVASNRADSGFWKMVADRYGATQVVWECKNYADLHADDFHQISYYLNQKIGRFGVIVWRGTTDVRTYADHLKRVADDNDKMVILLSLADLKVFVRQSINGKVKDSHIQDKFDRVVRLIS